MLAILDITRISLPKKSDEVIGGFAKLACAQNV